MATRAKAADGAPPSATAIELRPLEWAEIEIPILGVTPVIISRWTEKAKRLMLEKQQGKPAQRKEPKDPEAEAEASTYWLPRPKGERVPAVKASAFKAATAEAARFYDKKALGGGMTLLKRVIFVDGEFGVDGEVGVKFVPLDGEITKREDLVRNESGVADLRFRNQVFPWKATLKVRFMKSVISPEALVALIDAGGVGNGVCDHRPGSPKSMTGEFGTYRVSV